MKEVCERVCYGCAGGEAKQGGSGDDERGW